VPKEKGGFPPFLTFLNCCSLFIFSMSKRRQPKCIEDTIGLNEKTENMYLTEFLREQITSAIEGVPFTEINERIEEELMRTNSPRVHVSDPQSEELIDAHYDFNTFKLSLTSLFENVEVRSAREMEMALRLMRSNSLYHLREVFTEEENDSLESRNFYQSARFNFKNMADGFDRSISSNGKKKNFALYKEGESVFALTPNEVYCILDGKFKIGYRTGSRGISGILEHDFEYIPFNDVTVEEGKSFISPANNLLNYRSNISNNSPIVSDSFAAAYLILGSEADRYSINKEKESLSPLERLVKEDPSISSLISSQIEPIIEIQYKEGMSPGRIRELLIRGQSRLGKRTD